MATTATARETFEIDPVELEIFRSVVTSILDEIEVNLTRTAYSPLIYEYKDYTVAILGPDFRIMNQARHGLPMFLGDLGPPVADAVEQLGGQEVLAPGDVFITNYAAVQGQHLNNVVMATPIYQAGFIVAYIAIRAHWADVGGLEVGSISWHARDIWQEGTQYRGLRVMHSGELVPEVLATILANTRQVAYVRGDLFAQLGCCLLAQRRWSERIEPRWSADHVAGLAEAQRVEAAELARRAVVALPDGTRRVSCMMDDGGVPGSPPMELSISVSVMGEKLEIDLSGLPDQVTGPINTGRTGGGVSMCRLAFKALVAPDYPLNDGLFEPLTVTIPAGTVLSARKGAPMGHWNNCLAMMGDLAMKALCGGTPDRMPASHHGAMNLFSFSGVGPEGEIWSTLDTLGGGWGGSAGQDGFSPLKTNHHGDTREIPVEIMEARFPLLVESWNYRPDTGGAGRYRGGLGVEKVVRVLSDCKLRTAQDRTLDPPWGVAGGMPGTPGEIDVQSDPTSSWEPRRKVSGFAVSSGARVRVRSGGGGGWGAPVQRDPGAIEDDVLNGFVTPEEAQEVYGYRSVKCTV